MTIKSEKKQNSGHSLVLPMPTSSLSLGCKKVQRHPKLKLAEVFVVHEKTSLFVLEKQKLLSVA